MTNALSESGALVLLALGWEAGKLSERAAQLRAVRGERPLMAAASGIGGFFAGFILADLVSDDPNLSVVGGLIGAELGMQLMEAWHTRDGHAGHEGTAKAPDAPAAPVAANTNNTAPATAEAPAQQGETRRAAGPHATDNNRRIAA